MPERSLAGGRIRQIRLARGMAQRVLANNVGISPSYLNLIEHNKRRIAGRLVVALARELGVEAATLGEGVPANLLLAMGQAAAAHPDINIEQSDAQEIAGRFPGWAGVIAAQQGRVEELTRGIETLVDRLTHDPQLATSIHEMLSVVTAIRSTAGILADGNALEPEWQVRFHRNLLEDAKRLAGNAQALVAHLDASDGGVSAGLNLPNEALESWLSSRGFHVAELEGDTGVSVEELLEMEDRLTSSQALRQYAHEYLVRYRQDAAAVPMDGLLAACGEAGFDPLQFAQTAQCELSCVLRRLAAMPAEKVGEIGLVACDNSGTLTFRKPIAGFALPRFGAACPIWPLYQALSRPGVPIRVVVDQSGQDAMRFEVYALAQPVSASEYARAPLYEATMLILTGDGVQGEVQPVGSSCRICPREECRGRREPSILTSGF